MGKSEKRFTIMVFGKMIKVLFINVFMVLLLRLRDGFGKAYHGLAASDGFCWGTYGDWRWKEVMERR